mmetsp:Transcript_15724/g.35382  ORF Transcript_15724/g.35382 Transcript_15724/m.35382 type:complete len:751 (-) Transcript_15724:420-2672(-)
METAPCVIKHERGEKLTKTERQILEGFKQIKEDSKRDPRLRASWMFKHKIMLLMPSHIQSKQQACEDLDGANLLVGREKVVQKLENEVECTGGKKKKRGSGKSRKEEENVYSKEKSEPRKKEKKNKKDCLPKNIVCEKVEQEFDETENKKRKKKYTSKSQLEDEDIAKNKKNTEEKKETGKDYVPKVKIEDKAVKSGNAGAEKKKKQRQIKLRKLAINLPENPQVEIALQHSEKESRRKKKELKSKQKYNDMISIHQLDKEQSGKKQKSIKKRDHSHYEENIDMEVDDIKKSKCKKKKKKKKEKEKEKNGSYHDNTEVEHHKSARYTSIEEEVEVNTEQIEYTGVQYVSSASQTKRNKKNRNDDTDLVQYNNEEGHDLGEEEKAMVDIFSIEEPNKEHQHEQHRFDQNLLHVLPLVHKLRESVDSGDARKHLQRIQKKIPELSIHFIKRYKVGVLCTKHVRKKFSSCPNIAKLSKQIKIEMSSHCEKEKKNMQEGFEPKEKNEPQIDAVACGASSELPLDKSVAIIRPITESATLGSKTALSESTISSSLKTTYNISKKSPLKAPDIVSSSIPKIVKYAPLKFPRIPDEIRSAPDDITSTGDKNTCTDPKHPPFASHLQHKPHENNLPLWLSYNIYDLTYPTCGHRVVSYDFLRESTKFFPEDNRLDRDCIALALEHALFKFSGSNVEKYFEKMDQVCAGIMGRKFPLEDKVQSGSIIEKILEGKWKNVEDLVFQVSKREWFQSFCGIAF